jgi:transcriptional regulator with GAF, ATPase, and Fis domain
MDGDLTGWSERTAERPEAALKRVVALAQARIAGCDAASVTLMRGGRAMAVVSTADVARELDSAQCRTGEGPCLDAIRQLQVFNVATAADARSWPRFSEEAAARGIFTTLAVPLTVGGEAVGALNLYARRPDAFAGREADAVVFGSQAASTVSGALPGMRRREDRTGVV